MDTNSTKPTKMRGLLGCLNKQTKTYQDFPFDGGGVGDAKKDDGKTNVPN